MAAIHGVKVVLASLVLAAVVAGVATVVDEPYDRVVGNLIQQLDGDLQDRPAPSFQVSDLNGNPVSLSAFRGEVVFLNFWASWCPPCLEEFPSMLALATAMRDRPFRMIALTQDEDPEAMLAFLRTLDLPDDRILIAQDPEGQVAHAYGTRLLPESYIIDPRGMIVARFAGERDWSRPEAQQLTERLVRHPWRVGLGDIAPAASAPSIVLEDR
jgi:cytochrome c biogenesis protein CcmG, thiol:disulfide interchange protein DsbE